MSEPFTPTLPAVPRPALDELGDGDLILVQPDGTLLSGHQPDDTAMGEEPAVLDTDQVGPFPDADAVTGATTLEAWNWLHPEDPVPPKELEAALRAGRDAAERLGLGRVSDADLEKGIARGYALWKAAQ